MGKELGVPGGIQRIPGYVRMIDADPEDKSENLALDAIISELNSRMADHDIGELQSLRAAIKGRPEPKSQSARKVFRGTHRHPLGAYAFHYGGRSELQFNVGFEFDNREFRHGVAFSFEPSRSSPWPELSAILTPKVKLFNKFMVLNIELFRDMRMWHDESNLRIGGDEMPGPIPWERVRNRVFVFLGKRQAIDRIDYDAVLTDMDRLLPLYRYVESGGATQPISTPPQIPFAFSPAPWSDKASSTVASQTQVQLDVALRHNEMQKTLYHRLASQHGDSNVSFENVSGVGTRVDIVVRRESGYWFYEIKTAQSPRACLREAIGQLLEYAFWPGAPHVTRLIVVGETAIDVDGEEYLRSLKERFSLPIEYEAISIQE